jgi:hypothetical protein
MVDDTQAVGISFVAPDDAQAQYEPEVVNICNVLGQRNV